MVSFPSFSKALLRDESFMLTGETRSVGKVEEEPYLHSGSGKRESVSSRGCPGRVAVLVCLGKRWIEVRP